MLASILAGLSIVETLAVIGLLLYIRRQASTVSNLEAVNSFQQGVAEQLTVALAAQKTKQEQDKKTDEATAKSASHDAAAAAKLLESLHSGPRA